MRLLDIIVTHYREAWDEGRKFFDMLALQRGISFEDIRVILINDGEDGALGAELFAGYPYRVDIKTIEHGGVSAARNAGIDEADAKWISFSDFDDMYAGVYGLRDVLTVLDTDSYDILWAEFISEDRLKDGSTLLHRRGENTVFIHGKYWLREWLMRTGLRFEPGMEFNEDSAFCTVAALLADYRRIGKIETAAPIYVWAFREGSATTTQGNRWKAYKGSYHRNKMVCEAFRKHAGAQRFYAMVGRTAFDAYHMLNLKDLPEELAPMLNDFRQWWKTHKYAFMAMTPETQREVWEASKAEHDLGDEEEDARWGTVGNLRINRDVSFEEWIKQTVEGLPNV